LLRYGEAETKEGEEKNAKISICSGSFSCWVAQLARAANTTSEGGTKALCLKQLCLSQDPIERSDKEAESRFTVTKKATRKFCFQFEISCLWLG
jgi:phosphoserine phosphatase